VNNGVYAGIVLFAQRSVLKPTQQPKRLTRHSPRLANRVMEILE